MRMPLECVTPRSARMRAMKSKLTAGVAVVGTLLAACTTDFGMREREPRPPAPVVDKNAASVAVLTEDLQLLQKRLEQHLAATGYESLLLHSGTAPLLFRDDQNYPFHAYAPFRHWVPLIDVEDCFLHVVPGRRPLLVFHRAEDYWHLTAGLPDTWWSDLFDIVPAADLDAARRALPADLSRAAYIGEAFAALPGWGVAAVNPERLLMRLRPCSQSHGLRRGF